MALIETFIAARKGIAQQVDAFRRDESGATAIEYALILALIFLAIITAVRQVAGSTSEMYGEIEDAMASATD